MLVQLQRLTTHSSRLRLVIMGRYRVLTALAGVPYRCWSLSGAMKKGEVASDADGADWQPCQPATNNTIVCNHKSRYRPCSFDSRNHASWLRRVYAYMLPRIRLHDFMSPQQHSFVV